MKKITAGLSGMRKQIIAALIMMATIIIFSATTFAGTADDVKAIKRAMSSVKANAMREVTSVNVSNAKAAQKAIVNEYLNGVDKEIVFHALGDKEVYFRLAEVQDLKSRIFARKDEKGIFACLNRLINSGSKAMANIYVVGCTKKQADNICLKFEEKTMPYYGFEFWCSKLGKNANVYFSPANAKKAIAESKKNKSAIKSTEKKLIKKGMSTKEKVVAIQKHVSSYIRYRGSQKSLTKALKTRKGNCVTYAMYFQALCDTAGLNCTRVWGTVDLGDDDGAHMWNKVKIGSTWYYVDACWARDDAAYALSKKLWKDHKLA